VSLFFPCIPFHTEVERVDYNVMYRDGITITQIIIALIIGGIMAYLGLKTGGVF